MIIDEGLSKNGFNDLLVILSLKGKKSTFNGSEFPKFYIKDNGKISYKKCKDPIFSLYLLFEKFGHSYTICVVYNNDYIHDVNGEKFDYFDITDEDISKARKEIRNRKIKSILNDN